jgi:hypothetical protein
MSIRDINWRRGLFRLWIIVSIPWIVGFGYVTLGDINKYYTRIQAEKEIKGAIEQFDKSWRKKEKAEVIDKLKQEKMVNDIVEELLSGQSAKSSQIKLAHTDELIKSLPREEQKKALSELISGFSNLSSDRQEEMLDALNYGSKHLKDEAFLLAGFTFIPPILFFLIGFSLLWAFRGFLTKQ